MPSPPNSLATQSLQFARTFIRLIVGLGWVISAITATAAVDKPEFEPALRAAVEPAVVPDAEISSAIRSALWNANRTAVAVALRRPAATRIYVFLRQRNGTFMTVDVSPVESGNFGKLGRSRTEYTRFETVPLQWLPRDDGYLQVVVRTRAWAGRQRYTVSEPLVIRKDGVPVYR